MIAAKSFPGQTVAVFGLARTGLAAVRALKEGGAEVIAWDDNAARARRGPSGGRARSCPGANGRGKISPP